MYQWTLTLASGNLLEITLPEATITDLPAHRIWEMLSYEDCVLHAQSETERADREWLEGRYCRLHG
jgi:hypothetical protein